jgi:hypothetical protein
MSVQIGNPQLQLDIESLVRVSDSALEAAYPLERPVTPSRLTADDAHVDLWAKQTDPLPEDAILVMIHQFYLQVEWFRQVIWFRRTDDRDELWSATIMEDDLGADANIFEYTTPEEIAAVCADDTSLALSVRRQGPRDESLVELLCAFLITGGGNFRGLDYVMATAHVGFPQLRLLAKRIDLHIDRVKATKAKNAELASQNETEIVRVARELGLHPIPSGDGPTAWNARCPYQNNRYTLWLSSKNGDQFGCPYCQVKGDADVLRDFIEGHAATAKQLDPPLDQEIDEPIIVPEISTTKMFAIYLSGRYDYYFGLGSADQEPPWMEITRREYLQLCFGENWAAINFELPEEVHENLDEKLNYLIDGDWATDLWHEYGSPAAKAFDYLKALRIGPDLIDGEKTGEIVFEEESRSVMPTDLVSIDLLQKRLDELDTGLKIIFA